MRQLLYGLWAGWTGVLLLSRTELVRFTVKTPPDGILGFCYLNGYPKQQDYFWFGAMVVGGLAGVLLTRLFLWAAGIFALKGKGAGITGIIAVICMAVSTMLGLSRSLGNLPGNWLFFAAGCILPWLGAKWHSPGPEAPYAGAAGAGERGIGIWIILCTIVSAIWVMDTGFHCCKIDGIHEGAHLLYVQAMLDGKRPGLDFFTEYGVLGNWTLFGWMKVFGLTIADERLYFLFVQAMGTAIHLAMFRLIGLGWYASILGAFVALSLSSATGIEYGIYPAARTAIALLAVIYFWKGMNGKGGRYIWFSGLLEAISLLFSPEFAVSAGVAIIGMSVSGFFGAGMAKRLSPAFSWAAIVLVGFFAMSFALFGWSLFSGVAASLSGGYGGARLSGHGAMPLIEFPWFNRWDPLAFFGRQYSLSLQLWCIGMMSTGMIAWGIMRREPDPRRVIGFGVGIFTLLALMPGLTRPWGQVRTAIPPCALLVGFMLDEIGWVRNEKKRLFGYFFGALTVLAVVLHVNSDMNLVRKYSFCGWNWKGMWNFNWPNRLGGVVPMALDNEDLVLAVGKISALSRKGEYVYAGAPAHAHLCFLADRSGLPPYPSTVIAATSRQRDRVLDSLREYRPPVALLSDMGIDIPYAVEHKEEVEYIKRNYRLALKTGTLEIYRLAEKR